MKIVCVGGGPAGLYFAILMKLQDPRHDITVIERNKPDDTFGWGVVFSDATLGNMLVSDPVSHAQITAGFNHWDDIDIHYKGRTVTSRGHGFCGIGRRHLLNLLQDRCRSLDVALRFQTDVTDEQILANADVVVACDGANSRIRTRYADIFEPNIDTRLCKFVWLGTHQRFSAFTFAFEETEFGWFQAHAYQFDQDTSTFIVETTDSNWCAAGLNQLPADEGIAWCERVFAKYLNGNPLLNNAKHLANPWINFRRIFTNRWTHKNIVLMGDAAHTAHFSIGSGTKLALEDAIELARQFSQHGHLNSQLDSIHSCVNQAFADYERIRKVEVAKLQNAARNSTEWFEQVALHAALDAPQFAYSLLTRSQRVSHENLRMRDHEYVETIESHIDQLSGHGTEAIPPMLTPFKLRGVEVPNRVVVSPMAQYSCRDGLPDDYYLVHLGSRAMGGAGLVFTEMTCPSPDARITPGCAGIYTDDHTQAWRRIVDFIHNHSHAKVALQLGHAGPKGSTQVGWERENEPLETGNWPLLAASPLAYGPTNQIPQEMTVADMTRVSADFVRATRMAVHCGFDWLELHCAHGYLLSAFLSPLTNFRTDEYGGSLVGRCRFPLEVFAAMRTVWPADKPMSVRISAHDWAPGGNTVDDAVEIARLFKTAGCDLIDVSSGQTTRKAKPTYGRMYQTPFSDRIRNEIGMATMAVGAIFEPDHVNSIIAAGRADLCALGRPHLADPYWTLHAAAQLNFRGAEIAWPKQYLPGRDQLYRNKSQI